MAGISEMRLKNYFGSSFFSYLKQEQEDKTFEETVEYSQYVPPKITYMVDECSEFPSMRKYWDDVENVSEAIVRWNEYKKETLNGVPSIGFWYIHRGQIELKDAQVALVSGKVPENVSAELILREFDSKQEIYNEEERSLIKKCATQVKDMQKSRGLAWCICYQEKFGI